MNIKLWLYFMVQPQIIVYEIMIVLMITGMVLASRRSRFWKWRYQFILEGLSFVASAVLLCIFGSNSGFLFSGFGEAFGALIGTVASVVLGLISISLWIKSDEENAKYAKKWAKIKTVLVVLAVALFSIVILYKTFSDFSHY